MAMLLGGAEVDEAPASVAVAVYDTLTALSA